jgi:glutamate 5-kinase
VELEYIEASADGSGVPDQGRRQGRYVLDHDRGRRAHDGALLKLCREPAETHHAGHELILVCSGAIAAGLPTSVAEPPTDIGTLQAVAAVGSQTHGADRRDPVRARLIAGRSSRRTISSSARSTSTRATLRRLDLGVIPIVNENDTVADDEIRYGDNDRLARSSRTWSAQTCSSCSPTPRLVHGGSSPRQRSVADREIAEVDAALEAVAGASGRRSSGGMASKLRRRRSRPGRACAPSSPPPTRPRWCSTPSRKPVGTVIRPREARLPSRKLWIASPRSAGQVVVDDSARQALTRRSLVAPGRRP